MNCIEVSLSCHATNAAWAVLSVILELLEKRRIVCAIVDSAPIAIQIHGAAIKATRLTVMVMCLADEALFLA